MVIDFALLLRDERIPIVTGNQSAVDFIWIEFSFNRQQNSVKQRTSPLQKYLKEIWIYNQEYIYSWL